MSSNYHASPQSVWHPVVAYWRRRGLASWSSARPRGRMKLRNSPSVLPSNRRCLSDSASVGCTTLPISSFASCDRCSAFSAVGVAVGCMRVTGMAAGRSRGSARLPCRRGDCPGPAARSVGRTLAATMPHGRHSRFGFLSAGCNPPPPDAHIDDIPGARSKHNSQTVPSSNSPCSKCTPLAGHLFLHLPRMNR